MKVLISAGIGMFGLLLLFTTDTSAASRVGVRSTCQSQIRFSFVPRCGPRSVPICLSGRPCLDGVTGRTGRICTQWRCGPR
jgi:hypothetical protein